MILLRVLAAMAGSALVVATLASALKTIVVPRGYASWLTRGHFIVWRRLFGLFARPSRPYARRDRVLAHFSPVA